MNLLTNQSAQTDWLKNHVVLHLLTISNPSGCPRKLGLRALQRQTAVTVHLKSEQLLLFAFAGQNSVTGDQECV